MQGRQRFLYGKILPGICAKPSANPQKLIKIMSKIKIMSWSGHVDWLSANPNPTFSDFDFRFADFDNWVYPPSRKFSAFQFFNVSAFRSFAPLRAPNPVNLVNPVYSLLLGVGITGRFSDFDWRVNVLFFVEE